MGFLRNLLKGASLTTALFVFQACYGTYKWLDEVNMSFKVVSAEDGKPVKDAAILTRFSDNSAWNLLGYTDEEGVADVFYGRAYESPPEFRIDGKESGYIVKDTVFYDLSSRVYNISLQKAE